MRLRIPVLLISFALVMTACASPGGTSASDPAPVATRGEGCGDVAYIIPSSPDATVTMGRIYEFIKTEKPSVEGTSFNADLYQIVRKGGFDLISVKFDNELGTVLFVEEPGAQFSIGWEGAAESEEQIRADLTKRFPDLPEAVVRCVDLSLFATS